jgi:hypothetical protein
MTTPHRPPPSETTDPPDQRVNASLEALVRLLARQAARELMASAPEAGDAPAPSFPHQSDNA